MLLDVNNVFVSCTNHRSDPHAYLAEFPVDAVGEIHLGGHTAEELPSGPLLIDSHGAAVADPVWTLFAELVARIGARPKLIEWDNDLPAWPVLAEWGEGFADFLGGFPPVADWLYLGCVARIEAARTRAFHAADAAPMDPARLVGADPGRLRLDLHPSVQVLPLRHPAVAIWAANQPGAAPQTEDLIRALAASPPP